MRDSVRHFAAEFIGIFALVFVGGAAIMSGAIAKAPTTWLNVALAHGIILAVMVSATMRISGHLNPAVTIGFLVARRIEPVMAGVYIIAQLLGAMLAAYVLKALYPAAVVEATRLGGQSLALDVSMTQGIMYEAIATFFLVFVVFGTAVDPKAPKIGGLAIGLTITADILDRPAHRRIHEPRALVRPRGRQRRLRGASRVLGGPDPRRHRGRAPVRLALPSPRHRAGGPRRGASGDVTR